MTLELGINANSDTFEYDAVHHWGQNARGYRAEEIIMPWEYDVKRVFPPLHEPVYEKVSPPKESRTLVNHLYNLVLPPLLPPGASQAQEKKYNTELLRSRLHLLFNLQESAFLGRPGAQLRGNLSERYDVPGTLTYLAVLDKSGLPINRQQALSFLFESYVNLLNKRLEMLQYMDSSSIAQLKETFGEMLSAVQTFTSASYAELELMAYTMRIKKTQPQYLQRRE